jgi:hypothetical protein
MKSKFIPSLICLLGLIFCMVNGCASTASNTEKGTTGSYFTGSGGQGIRLGILVPQSQGLNEKDYIPAMVQGVLVSNVKKYSAISVLDRVSLDKVITETLNPTYEDNFDIVRLGHVAQVGYMMTGNIIRTSSGYSMQINVTDTTPNANTIAAYSGNFSVVQIDDYTAINRASIDLLTQMGVALTATAKNELGRASPQQEITAQTAMAQGIEAQRKGQTVESIFHYFDATALESIATEALSRMSMATTTIATGSLGNQIRNDIEQRKEWIRLIEETRKYFANNLFYNLAELYYSPYLNLASINYTAETANLTFPVRIRLNNERAQAMKKIISDIHNGLEATGRQKQWGISVFVDPLLYAYKFDFDLVNANGKVISSTTTPNFILLYYSGNASSDISLGSRINDGQGKGHYITDIKEKNSFWFYSGGNLKPKKTDKVDLYSSSRVLVGSYSEDDSAKWIREPSFRVKASDITGTLSIRLKGISVYQIPKDKLDFETGGVIFFSIRFETNWFKLIKTGNNIIPVNTGTF